MRRNKPPRPPTFPTSLLPLAEALENRQLLSAGLHPNYTGTLILTKALPAAGSRRIEFDLTVMSQGNDGQFTGDLSAGQLGTFAFEGSARGRNVQFVFEGETGGAGVLAATLSGNGTALNGRWTSTIDSAQISGTVHAAAGGIPVPPDAAPPALGQSTADVATSGPFSRAFVGTAPSATPAPSSTTASSSRSPAAGATMSGASGAIAATGGAITGGAGAIPIADSTGAIAGSTGAITGSTGAITGSTGAITGSTGAITGSTGAITGSIGFPITGATGAITGPVGAITGATGAITGNAGAIVGGAGAIPIADSTGAITGSTGAITGTGIAIGAGAGTGASGAGANSSTVAAIPAPAPAAPSQPVTLVLNTQTRDGLLTGTFTVGQTVFNVDAFVRGNHLTMVLSGAGSGLAQATLAGGRSSMKGTFDALAGGSPLAAAFSIAATGTPL
jgi:hypothetical protein